METRGAAETASTGGGVAVSRLEEALLRGDLSALRALAPEGDLSRLIFPDPDPKEGALDPNLPAKGWTPLHVACEWGHGDVVELLLQHGAHIDALTVQKLRSGGPAWSALDLSFEPKQKIVPTTKAVQCLVRVDASVWTGDGVGNLSTVAINSGKVLKSVATSSEREARVYGLLLAEDRVWSFHDDNVIRIWSKKKLKEARQLVGHRELVRTMHLIRRSTSQPPQVWSADISGTVIVWDALKLRREEEIVMKQGSPIFSMCQVHGSVWMGGETDIFTLHFQTMKRREWKAHDRPINDLLYHAGRVWSAGNDCKLKLWKVSEGDGEEPEVVRVVEVGEGVSILCLKRIACGFGRTLVVGGCTDGSILVWDHDGNQVHKFGTQQGAVRCLLWLSDEQYASLPPYALAL
ncbi:WD domain, G-beta repeat-containing protein [Acanthamoeba castellanii str. Neff]|uniref:WD domain, G-beta repeat-containing protein n=1 Tax=Acanthamoeba castellanii (strain ATCC 30010 / Neff) TaxID=1257118 RepID=L8H0S2_ACACF|nr:WD domain, G-beta repeat-containing protein [Acanthamoeba castellanii str. Neff]ELR18822.1 WD domain, G-beta repeat-containing protein [Acanthamoeba castellanii str. Neff]